MVTFETWTGDQFSIRVAFTNNDGSAFDLTGYTFAAAAKLDGDTSESLTWSMQLGSSSNTYLWVVGLYGLATAGAVSMTLPSSVTAAMTPGVYSFDLRLTSASGAPRIFLGGAKLTVHQAISP